MLLRYIPAHDKENKEAEEDNDNATRDWNHYGEHDRHWRVIRRAGLHERLRGGQSARHWIAVGACARVRGVQTRAVGSRRARNAGAEVVTCTHKQKNKCKSLKRIAPIEFQMGTLESDLATISEQVMLSERPVMLHVPLLVAVKFAIAFAIFWLTFDPWMSLAEEMSLVE